MNVRTIAVTSLVAAAAALSLASRAEAGTVIKNPNDHPDYKVELEPHGDIVLFHPGYGLYGRRGYYGRGAFGYTEFGAGFRASIELADPAFIPKLNNTVAISFGIDLTNCEYCAPGYRFSIWTPVALQWNFFLTDKWSVFADLGLAPRTEGFYHHVYFDWMGEIGGRYHFSDKVSLTMRIGYPFVSVGVSFFAG